MTLRRQVFSLAVWPLLEQLMGFLVSSVDLVLAGWSSQDAERIAIMDGLGLAAYIAWLMMILQGAVGVGVMALVSRAAGARDQKMASSALGQGLLIGFATGFVAGIVIRLSLQLVISIYPLSEAAGQQAYDYLSILWWMCPVLGVMLAATHALRGVGDTLTPFLAMVAVNAVNMCLSWLFVFGPEPFGGMGVRGLALGTVLAWCVGMVLVLGILFFRNSKTTWSDHRLKGQRSADHDGVELSLRQCSLVPEKVMIRRIMRVGTPQALEMMGMWAINCVSLIFVAGLKPEGSLGAHWIAIRVESMSFLPGLAIGTASAALVGQYLGARNPEMGIKAVRMCWRYGVIFMSILGVLFLAIPELLVSTIVPGDGDDAALLIGLAAPLVFLCGLFQPILATTMILKLSLRGAGATKAVMAHSFISMIFFRGIMIPVAVTYWGAGLRAIWLIMFADVLVQALMFMRLHFKGDWVKTNV